MGRPSALFAASALAGLVFGVFSPRWRAAAAFAALGWSIALAAMMFYNKAHYGQFFLASAYDVLGFVLRCVVATIAAAWVASRTRRS